MHNTPIDLTNQKWTLYGTMPYAWRNAVSMELGLEFEPEVGPVPIQVPGSVQQSLIDAGIVQHWKYDMHARNLEWIENRHWIYSCTFGKELISDTDEYELVCEGLDYAGWVYLNSSLLGTFENGFIPHTFDITPEMLCENNQVRIIFKNPPRWLGQLGYTSQIRDWKPRFNYSWDWVVRVVQTAVTGSVHLKSKKAIDIQLNKQNTAYDLESHLGSFQAEIECSQDSEDTFQVTAEVHDRHGTLVSSQTTDLLGGHAPIVMENLEISPWWPNRHGEQPLYELTCKLKNSTGEVISQVKREIGFTAIRWERCEGALPEATPWICRVNGKPIFLQGVNWTPLSPTFADVPFGEVKKRLELYKELGCNLIRVWGGAVLESEAFYQECSRLGLFVWQELPLSSSGIDNWPPEDPTVISQIAEIAESYIMRRAHHVSLLLWSGGNELQGAINGDKAGIGKPVDFSHPMMSRLKTLFESLDPSHRFIPTSPFGPRFKADTEENNMGLHWSVHGPWNIDQVLDHRWSDYWEADDSLLRPETGCPGAMDPNVLKQYVPSYDVMPVQHENPVWGRNPWWIESDVFELEFGRAPKSAEEYCNWSQERQSKALEIAVKATKKRFPGSGGIIIWMGHDCFPCAANTSIIDVDGNPKPAYYAIQNIFLTPQKQVNKL